MKYIIKKFKPGKSNKFIFTLSESAFMTNHLYIVEWHIEYRERNEI